MLTEKEIKFLRYWEQHRERESKFISKLGGGLPMAILFALPIVLLVVVVWLYFPEWYTKISKTSPGAFVMVIIAMIGIVIFYSFFRMHYKWEMNDQLYKELKPKENKINKAADPANFN